MNTEKKYSGVVIPAVTPLTASHHLDVEAVEKMFDHFHNNAVDPFILGTTGEAASLPFSLKKEYLLAAGRLKRSEDILFAGISSNVFAESLDLAKYSFDNGADVVVATLPSYYALSESSMLSYLEQLADRVAGPLMIYNIPATIHMSIPLQVIERLSYHPNIVGIKDSERSEERLKQSIQLWKDRKDFSHFLGWAAESADALLAGSDGLVPSTGNFEPKLYADLYKAAKGKNYEKAFSLQKLSDALGAVYQQGRTLGESLWALKVVMNEFELCETHVMPPVYAQSNDEKKLRATLKEILKEEIK